MQKKKKQPHVFVKTRNLSVNLNYKIKLYFTHVRYQPTQTKIKKYFTLPFI